MAAENFKTLFHSYGDFMKTWIAKTEETDRKWFIVDASGQRLGRIATHIANILRGKNLPTFTPHADAGGFVVVINSDKIEMTGNKWNTKKYFLKRYKGTLHRIEGNITIFFLNQYDSICEDNLPSWKRNNILNQLL